MFNLFPILLLVIGLGGVIYIVSDHLSEFSASGEEDEKNKFSFGVRAKLAGWINQLPLDDIKAQSLSLTQKLLHKMRIILLKADNRLMKLISKMSEKDKTTPSDSDFWQDFSNDNQKISQVDLVFKSNPETKKFFDIKPVEKTTKIKVKKSSK